VKDPCLEINAPSVDVERVANEIRAAVASKKEAGGYADPVVGLAERFNPDALRGSDEFLRYYLESLREMVFVDINDFEIVERRSRFRWLLKRLKQVLWSLLKFYTYRLWSQQNRINGVFLSTIENMENRYRDRLIRLEARVAELEKEQECRKPRT
jgi:hypothetical protein